HPFVDGAPSRAAGQYLAGDGIPNARPERGHQAVRFGFGARLPSNSRGSGRAAYRSPQALLAIPNGHGYGFIDHAGIFTTISYPSAFTTQINGITPDGVIFGL